MTLPNLLAVGNHLWQSTAFACAAWMLTLLLRKNSARVRHAIWFVASLKFLVPISWLIDLGGRIHWRSVPAAAPAISLAIDQISEPFSVAAPLAVMPTHAVNPLPMILFAIWMVGALGIAVSWMIRYRRIRTSAHSASVLPLDLPVRVMSSSSTMEPGVFGILHPVLLLPEGIFERLSESQLSAVIEHELCHVRHRDNLIASIQMFVETVFWFHPLVWWIGKRMVAERELACDEEVLRRGSEPRVYAEGILNVCKLYAESPLVCVAGVTGADLKRRIEAIVANRVGQRLNRAKKILLTAAGVMAVVCPLLIGIGHVPVIKAQSRAARAIVVPLPAPVPQPVQIAQAQAPPQRAPSPVERPAEQPAEKPLHFDAASIKPFSGQLGGRNGGTPGGPPGIMSGNLRFMPGRVTSAPGFATARKIILEAYHLTQYQLSGGPDWLDSDRFDLQAVAEGASQDQLRRMLQTLLAERFGLTIHREAREMPVFNLVVAKGGTKLHEWKEGDPMPGFGTDGRPKYVDRGNMQRLADVLTGNPDVARPVLDKTGLPGTYVFYVAWDEGEEFLPALQEQLGLKLESTKAPVDCLVIDSIQKPEPN